MDEKLLGNCGFYFGACPIYIKGVCRACEKEHTTGNCFTRDFVASHTQEAQTEFIRSEIAKGKDFYMLNDHISVGIVSVYGSLIENLYVLF